VCHILAWNYLLAIVQSLQCLFVLAFLDKLASHLHEHTSMGLSHTEYGFVQVDVILVNTTELELVHQVVIHLFAVQTGIELGGIERSDAISQAFLHEVVTQVQVIFLSHGDGHVDWAFPVGVGKHFEHHQFALVQHALALQRDAHVFRDFTVQGTWYHHARTLDGFLVQLDDDAVGRNDLLTELRFAYPVAKDVLQFVWVLAEFLGGFGRVLLVELVDGLHHFRTDSYRFVMTLYIFQTAPFDRYGRRVVRITLHLVDVPVGLQVAEVTYTYIGTVSFHFLVVPQWEGIVVAIGEDNRIAFFLKGIQVVLSKLAGYIASASVVVVPSLAHHLYRHEQAKYGSQDSSRLFTYLLFQPTGHTSHTHTHPDGKGIERTGIRIVAFTRLHRSLVQVEHDGKTGHEEKEEYHPELLDAFFTLISLPEQTDEAKYQRQAEEHVVSLVVLQVAWQEFLIAYQEIVNERDTGNPVAMFDFSITLDVVLTSGKVPHEVTPVHEVHLIGEEILDVFPLGRNLQHQHFAALVVRYGASFDAAQPVFVILCMLFAIHTREKHVLSVIVFGFVTYYFVAVLFVGRFFFLALIYRSTFYHIVYTSTVHFFQCRLRCVCLSVEQWTGTVLLTTEVFTQGKDVFRGVLVHRSIGCRTNHDKGIRRIAHHNHHDAEQGGIECTGTDLPLGIELGKQVSSQGTEYDEADDNASESMTIERNTQHGNGCEEGDVHPLAALFSIAFIDTPDDGSCQ